MSAGLLGVRDQAESGPCRSAAQGRQPDKEEGAMSQEPEDDDLEPEYDFSGAVPARLPVGQQTLLALAFSIAPPLTCRLRRG